jgi:hypothetical protein
VGMGIEPIRPEGHRFLRPARLPLRQPTILCEWGESNPHEISLTTTSK